MAATHSRSRVSLRLAFATALAAAMTVVFLGALNAQEIPTTSAATTEPSASTRPATRPARSGNRVSVEHEMENMARCLKKLKEQAADPAKKEENLSLVTQMQQSTMAIKSVLPKQVTRVPADQQAKKAEWFRSMMISVLQKELDLEDQINSGELSKVDESITALGDLRTTGHEELGVRED